MPSKTFKQKNIKSNSKSKKSLKSNSKSSSRTRKLRSNVRKMRGGGHNEVFGFKEEEGNEKFGLKDEEGVWNPYEINSEVPLGFPKEISTVGSNKPTLAYRTFGSAKIAKPRFKNNFVLYKPTSTNTVTPSHLNTTAIAGNIILYINPSNKNTSNSFYIGRIVSFSNNIANVVQLNPQTLDKTLGKKLSKTDIITVPLLNIKGTIELFDNHSKA